ncbi:MAG TPA: ATP-grasp domain-containing protein [Gemmatimonadaceae bacterium]|nr:ATP-grasp domain-containing protein [Gemmatimonadaceae bacterium]
MKTSAQGAVLLAGVSVRALAESAARAGASVIALDAYGDLDLRRIARVVAIPRDGSGKFDQIAVARASRDIDASSVAYVSSFENAPEAVEVLSRDRALLGNSPDVLRRVRDPLVLARALARIGVHTPAVRASAPLTSDATRWLLKPRHSGGGHGIVRWTRGMRVPRTSIVQQQLRGDAGSIIFVADGARIEVLALTRQLSGDPALGASGFAYCGSILEPHRPALLASATALATAITREFALRGVCGVDFIAQGDVPFAIEVNPRPTASMELVERATGRSIWLAHVAGCTGSLASLAGAGARTLAHGKAVLYARRPVVLGDTTHWLADDDVRDIPAPFERIARGSPICTIFASGRTSALCYAALMRRARIRFAEVEGRMRRRSA